jgi:hypothetical protein
MTDELNHEIDHRNPDNASRNMGHGGMVFDPVDFPAWKCLFRHSFGCLGCYRFSGVRVLKKYSQNF